MGAGDHSRTAWTDPDLYVLVLRVVPGRHPRPLLVDGVADVQHQNTTHPADWQRLRDPQLIRSALRM
jgi:hypothetical protein